MENAVRRWIPNCCYAKCKSALSRPASGLWCTFSKSWGTVFIIYNLENAGCLLFFFWRRSSLQCTSEAGSSGEIHQSSFSCSHTPAVSEWAVGISCLGWGEESSESGLSSFSWHSEAWVFKEREKIPLFLPSFRYVQLLRPMKLSYTCLLTPVPLLFLSVALT